MPSFSIDNDRVAPNIQDVHYDQSAGVQTQLTPDTGDEIDIALDGSNLLDGEAAGFKTFLAGLSPTLSTAQKTFAVGSNAASSSSSFIQVTADPGETLNDLKLQADPSVALNIQTLAGESLYAHVDASGNYATFWTSSDNSGRIVGAAALVNETIDNVTTHMATAGVQMVYFEAIKQTDTTLQDESVSLGDALKVAVDTAVSFNFSQLDAGNFLWAAVGDGSAAMLITGQDMNVIDQGGKLGDKVNSGSSDPCDTVNTSKATDTTIGVNAQHFAPTNTGDGATGVFTFVSGYVPLEAATPQYTGQNITQIDYDSFINVSSANVFISQLTGGSAAKIHFSLWEAGGGAPASGQDDDQLTTALKPEEGYADVAGQSVSYIGNQDTDRHLTDDTIVNVGSVTIGANTWNWNDANITTGVTKGNITVTINGNNVIVDGAHANDLIGLTARDDPSTNLDGTFNRVDIQALSGSASFDIGHIDLTSGGITAADLGSHLFVDDDGPVLQPQAVATDNNLEVANTVNATDSSSYTPLAGTDGQKSLNFINPDSSGDFTWAYFDVNGDNTVGNNEIKGQYKGNDLYTMVINPDGTYSVKMIGTLPGTQEGLGTTIIHAGGPTDTVDVLATKGTDFGRIVADSTVGAGLVNASHGFVGVDNGNLDNGESLNLSLHKANGDFIDFTGLTVGTKSAQTCKYDVFVHMADGSDVQVADDVSIGKNGTITVNDPDTTDNVLIESVTVFKVDGTAIKIGLGDIQFILPPSDVQLSFDVQLKDGDNDPANQSFTLDIDGNNDGHFDATVSSLSVINQQMSLASAIAPHEQVFGL